MKKKHKLERIDIIEFYPSINENLLLKALEFAKCYKAITEDDMKIIKRADQSMLFNQGQIQIETKNNNNETHDITMGSKLGTEIGELFGLYLLKDIANITN